MNKEEMLKQKMIVCNYCGWEIARSNVWINPVCDDCSIDIAVEREKEKQNANC